MTDLAEVYRAANVLLPNRIDPLTFDEWHSFVLGLNGFWLGRGRHPRVAFALALFALTSPPADADADRSPAADAIRKEPWYFTAGLLASYAVGRTLS